MERVKNVYKIKALYELLLAGWIERLVMIIHPAAVGEEMRMFLTS